MYKTLTATAISLFFIGCLAPEISLDKNKDLQDHDQIFYKQKKHTIVDVLYGTDRGVNPKAPFEERYMGRRDKLKFGVAQVSVPMSHKVGMVEQPWSFWGYKIFDEKLGKHVMITKLEAIKEQRFRELLEIKLGKVKQEDLLIFIHGYNVTFASALRRTAQLSYDLKFKGVPLNYSWTSQGSTSQYMKDEESVQYTTPHLLKFLREVIKNRGDANIHILAHSMGTRALTNALKELSYLYDTPQFKNIILAAPDIDVEVFESNLYPHILKTAEKVTIYANSEDRALQISNELHDGRRLGEGGENISVFKDMVTIDATGIDTSMLAHSYFAEKELLVNDLREVVHKSLPPQKRQNLIEKLKEKLQYWKFSNK